MNIINRALDVVIPLHVHTTKGSIGDSTLKIKEYIKKAKALKLPSIGMSNHGSLSDMFEFFFKCLEEGINPIIGCEVYETTNRLLKDSEHNKYWHLVLIAKNEVGFRNLLHITSDAQLNGYYYKPRTDIEFLREHGEGIIALTACVGGKIPQMILGEAEEDDVVKAIREYQDIFDEVYLEIQPGNFKEQIETNQAMVYLSEQYNIPLVMTNDIHYLDEEDWKIHDYHVRLNRKQQIDPDGNILYPDKCYYLMSKSELMSYFDDNNIPREAVKRAINNTLEIAAKVSLDLSNPKIFMPEFNTPLYYTEETYLIKLCTEELEKIKDTVKDPAEYASRLEYELEVICDLGFAGYFLTVQDYILEAHRRGIAVAPGRGSVCCSLVAFLLGITKIDPIKYDLLFERFLSKSRKGSIPDIDCDFQADRRQEMFDYVVEKYGLAKCALVSTFGMRKAKAAIRDAARLFEDIDKEVADTAAKLIPLVYYSEDGDKQTDLSIEESLAIVKELRDIREQYPEWIDAAMKLEGLPSHASIHAAGTLIAPVDLINHIPLIKPKSEGINATALCLKDCESAGFVKYDFLGISTLTIVNNVEKQTGDRFDYAINSFSDEKVWNLIGSKHTTGLFQIGTKTYKERMPRLKPKTISELAACLALVRGPCISAKQDQLYMEILEGKKEVELIHPFYDNATAETLGILIYQEQLMQIFVNCGFSLEKSFKAMKLLAKKDAEKVQAFKEEFDEKVSDYMDEEIREKLWTIIINAALYLFNKGHAIGYAMVVYCTAYHKVYHPMEYTINCLTNAYERKEEIEETVADCRKLGYKFLPLSINNSQWSFTIEDGMIRIGLCALKGFGEKATIEVMEKRPFSSMNDLLERITKAACKKNQIINAIFAGGFEDFGDRLDVYEEFCNLRDENMETTIKVQGGEPFTVDDSYDTIESKLLSSPLISDPVNNFEPIGFDTLKKNEEFEIQCVVKRVKKIKDRAGKNMAFLTLETADGYLDCVMFSHVYDSYKRYCKKDLMCFMTAKKDNSDSCIAVKVS